MDKSGLARDWAHDRSAGLAAQITEDGQILRAEKTAGCCPQASDGGLIQLFDFDGNLNWSYKFADDTITQHHTLLSMDNGNILFLGWEILSDVDLVRLGKEDLSSELWSEFVWEIEPIGTNDFELVWAWHLKDHLVQDVFPDKDNFVRVDTAFGKIDINYRGPHIFSDRDWWHTNALHYNSERDEVLINCRSNGETWIIDHSTTIEEAQSDTGGRRNKGGQILFRWGNPQSYQRGSEEDLLQYGSHGHNWITEGFPDGGKILFFNNGHERPGPGFHSTVEMILPAYDDQGNYIIDSNYQFELDSHEVVYGEDPTFQPLNSSFLSNAVQINDGHFFISEGQSGRVFEIDNSSNIVWEIDTPGMFASYVYKKDNPIFDDVEVFLLPRPAADRRLICNTECLEVEVLYSSDLNPSLDMEFVEWSDGSTDTTLVTKTPGEYFYWGIFEGDTVKSNSIFIELEDVSMPEPRTVFQTLGEPTIIHLDTTRAWFKSDECITRFRKGSLINLTNLATDTTFWIAGIGTADDCYTDKVPLNIIFNTSSTEDINPNLDISISPNPTSTGFRINNLDQNRIRSVRLSDASGVISELKPTDNFYDTSHCLPGLYYVIVETDEGEVVKKLIVN